MERNVIGKNTIIVGEIKSDGDFRIDGTLEGNLTIKGKVIIGAAGIVKGNISASTADIEGETSGQLKVIKTLTVKAMAKISGDVVVGKLSIEPGATFNASCVMKGFAKEENKPDSKRSPYIYIDVNSETNRCYTFPGHCSLDPTVCLIASQQLPFGIVTTLLGTLRQSYPFYDTENPGYGGKFMNTLVNVNWVAGILKSHQTSNPKGDVPFVDFMQDVLTGISKACGGFNEYRIVPDDDSRCVRIFDDKRLTACLLYTSDAADE